jgi:hypothetical protein
VRAAAAAPALTNSSEFISKQTQSISIGAYALAGSPIRLVTVILGPNHVSHPVQMRAKTANDAVSELRDYVQISDSVTKVLIYKRLRALAFRRELTNLET